MDEHKNEFTMKIKAELDTSDADQKIEELRKKVDEVISEIKECMNILKLVISNKEVNK